MIGLLVCPYIMTVPDSGSAGADIERWWIDAVEWLVELQDSRLDWRQIVECTDLLMAEDRFITFDRLRRLQIASGADINPAIVSRVSRQLQNGERDYKASTTTKYVLSNRSVSISPPELLARISAGCQVPLHDALVAIAVDKSINEEFAQSVRLVDLPHDPKVDELCIEGDIDSTDPETIADKLDNGHLVECFEVFTTPKDLGKLDPREILAIGTEEFVRYLNRVTRLNGEPNPLPCQLHPVFLESLSNSSIDSNATGMNTLVRRCGEILGGIAHTVAGAELRWFRTNPNASSGQRTRASDGARAWRVTITKSGVGWRMNYWRIPGSMPGDQEAIEFAWVQHETDPPFIPE